MNMTLTATAEIIRATRKDCDVPVYMRASELAKMCDVDIRRIHELIRDNGIQARAVGNSGKRYLVFEVVEAIEKTKGKEFPRQGGSWKDPAASAASSAAASATY